MVENLQKFNESGGYIEQSSFNLDKTVRQFTEKNNSPETRRTYAAYLREFFAFAKVKNSFQVVQVKSETVTAWRETMKAQGRKPNTVKTKLAAIRSFYEHLKH